MKGWEKKRRLPARAEPRDVHNLSVYWANDFAESAVASYRQIRPVSVRLMIMRHSICLMFLPIWLLVANENPQFHGDNKFWKQKFRHGCADRLAFCCVNFLICQSVTLVGDDGCYGGSRSEGKWFGTNVCVLRFDGEEGVVRKRNKKKKGL